jgi:hypothetical protein
MSSLGEGRVGAKQEHFGQGQGVILARRILAMSDIVGMDTSQKSRSGEEPGPQDQTPKKEDAALKEKPIASGEQEKKKAQESVEMDEPEAEDEEPGTFDRVYEHGRQMGF